MKIIWQRLPRQREKLNGSQWQAAVGSATWRHLHGIEAGSDERRGNAWGEGRRWHAYRTRKDWRLERTHTNHWLLHRRNLTTFTGINWISQVRMLCSWFPEINVIKLFKIISDQVTKQLAIHNLHINITVTDPHINAESLFTCARGAAAAATGNACISSGCCGSERPLWVSSSGRSRVFFTPVHSSNDTV